MKLLLFFSLSLFLSQLATAQNDHNRPDSRPALKKLDLSIIMHDMVSRDFETRKSTEERLLELSRHRLPLVAKALFQQIKTSKNPELRSRSKSAFKKIFEFKVLGKGDSNLGVLWHWHIQLAHQGEMRARPVVREINPESAAAKAGLKKGDIVCYIDGKELHRQEGLVALRRIFREAKPGQEITLTVRNVQFSYARYTSNPAPNRKVTLKVARSDKAIRTAKKGEFEKWLAALKTEYDVN